MSTTTHTPSNTPLLEPRLEFAFEIRVDCAEDIRIGRSAEEVLGFIPIIGGTVEGPRLRGEVVPGGGDWAIERGGTFHLDARYVVRTDDGAAIDVHNRGYYRASPEVMERAERGGSVSETEAYFRTSPVFQTDSPAHRWLTEHQFIGMARDEDRQIRIRFFLLT